MRSLLVGGLAGLAVLLSVPVAHAGNDDCLGCHGEKDITASTERGKKLKLHVDPKALAGSPHESLGCTDCHGGEKSFEDAPHNNGMPLSFKCGDCHDAQEKAYSESVHGVRYARGDRAAAHCSNCHGGHDIRPSGDRESRTNPFNLASTCGKCHQSESVLKTHNIGQKDAVPQFVDSIHGRALLQDGLIVAPTCNNCHGVHDILPAADPKSRVHKDGVAKTCGKCHVLVEETYLKSIHGQLLKNFDERGPTCNTCHTSHQIMEPNSLAFRMLADERCGKCHQDRLENYRETFHGKAMALGRPAVATCYDCHGHHDIQKSANPESRVSDGRRLETCKRCHSGANESFAGYIVHATHTDKDRYPVLYWVYLFMTLLLLGTFLFFAVHSMLWLFRSAALFTGDSREFREHKEKTRNDPEQFVRFRPVDRFLHGLVIFSFLILVMTGMPLKFYYMSWAQHMLHAMGGQQVAGVIHRIGALITIFYFSVHVLTVAVGFLGMRSQWKDPKTGKFSVMRALGIVFGPDSPMPNLQDAKDFIAHQKWFFGKGPQPQFDRWTYWEKFDYLAVFWGVFMIGMSGLIMWIPETMTHVLPGWMINVSLIIHSDEALLAAGFIFTFHFFNVHFRPEKFPLDPVIFSGRISKTEMLHERKRQYDRWEAAGEVDKHRLKDEWDSWKWIALPAGFLAFCVGVGLVVLIFYAMLSRLLGG